MSGFDPSRIALVKAKPKGRGAQDGESVGTGYFLRGDLVLTARHVADLLPDPAFRVRSEIGLSEADRWSDARPVWTGDGNVDAMLLRTERRFGDWEPPQFLMDKDGGSWESSGYADATAEGENRKTLPLSGSFGMSLGQGPPALSLRTADIASVKYETTWKGISGAPVFLAGPGEDGGLIGIITEARRKLSNDLVGLSAKRMFEDIDFWSAIFPSFLAQLPEARFCLVLTSENSKSDLVEQTADVLTRFREDEIQFQGLHEEPISVSALEAVGSAQNWAATVKALARADYLIADVTSFEPVVMLLLGVRSVLRRGVTISVDTKQSAALSSELPFNVQETRVLSFNDENFDDNLHLAMTEGAANLDKDQNYLDLPAYKAVRAPRPESWAESDDGNLLVLCPFAEEYSKFYKNKLRKIIQAHTGNKTPLRMLDLRSPRLVGQALYEQVRWSSWCLVDWTAWRPNVFFELGVRLACSGRDPMCIVQDGHLEGAPAPADGPSRKLDQYGLLLKLFEPVVYDPGNPRNALKEALQSWPRPPEAGRQPLPPALPPAATFKVAQANFEWQRDPMLTQPHIEQRRAAELISSEDQEQQPERLVLFADNEMFNAELEAAVREKWIAAWLYLRHVSPADNEQLVTLASLLDQVLKFSNVPRHAQLRDEIKTFLKPKRSSRHAGESDSANG